MMSDTSLSSSEARSFLLALAAAFLFGMACLAAALGPAGANCFCAAATYHVDRPALL